MAQKFEIPGGYAWNVEQCEELLLIAGYEEIYRYIPADQTWKHEFETHFFEIGDGVAAEFVEAINAVRKRCELEVIVIRETNLYEYGRSPDKRIKTNNRRRIREELNDASADERQRRIEWAKVEEQRLPPPHRTYEERKAWKQQQQEAQAASRAPRLVKMLSLTTSPSIRGDIIQNLSADEALEVAEKIEDTELRDALIKHSLGAILSDKQTRD